MAKPGASSRVSTRRARGTPASASGESSVSIEEGILACISSDDNLSGLAEQVKAYAGEPVVDAKHPKENVGHARAKKLVPFLGRVLKQCGAELRKVPMDGDSAAQKRGDELFAAMSVALDALDSIRPWLVGGRIEIEMQRYGFLRRLMSWKRYKEGADECVRILWSLNVHARSTIKDNRNATPLYRKVTLVEAEKLIFPPPGNCQDIILGLPGLIAGLVSDLILSTVESGVRDFATVLTLARLPLQLEPWLSTMDAEEQEKQRENLFKVLYRTCSILVLESLKAEAVYTFSTLTLDYCARTSQSDQYLKVARKLCSSVTSMPNAALEICVFVFTNLLSQNKLRRFLQSSEFFDYIDWYTKFCQSTGRYDHGWHHIRNILRSKLTRHGDISLAFIGLYAFGLKFFSEGCPNDQCGNIVTDSDLVETEKLVGTALADLAERLASVGEERQVSILAVFRALDFVRRNMGNFVQSEWNAFLSSVGQAERRHPSKAIIVELIQLLHLYCKMILTASSRHSLSPDEKDMLNKGRHGVATTAVAALRLSLATQHFLEESVTIIHQLLSNTVIPMDELRWLISVTYNIGVQIYNKKHYELAYKPLELAHYGAWARVENLSSSAGDQIDTEAVFEACQKTAAFIDCLMRNNDAGGMDVLRNALISWVRVETRCSSIDWPRGLLRLWCKMTIQLSSEECCLYSSLCGLQPPLPPASLGMMLEQQMLALNDIESEQSVKVQELKDKILEYLMYKVYVSDCLSVERSAILIEKSRILRREGVHNLPTSIRLLSESLELLNKALRTKDGRRKLRLIYQCALAYSLRAHCTQEADPFSEDYLEDIVLALRAWREFLESLKGEQWDCTFEGTAYMLPKEAVLYLLRNTADLLSLKAMSALQQEVQVLILRITMHGQKSWSPAHAVSAWAQSRVNHVLCQVPISRGFMSILQDKFGSEADSLSTWYTPTNETPGTLADARQLMINADFPSSACPSSQHFLELDKQLKSGDGLPLNGLRERIVASGLKFYLAEVFGQNGDLQTAVKYAKDSLQLRLKLLNRAFQLSKEHHEVGAPECTSKCKVPSKFEACGTSATLAWPSLFGAKACYQVGQWHILGDYIESLMQVGVLHEKHGFCDEAERTLREGLWLAEAQNLPLACLQFSTRLGEIYRKQHLWDRAEEAFQNAVNLAENLEATSFCPDCVNLEKAYLQLCLGNFVWHSPDVNMGERIQSTASASRLHAACAHYESAKEVLNDLIHTCTDQSHIREPSISGWISFKWNSCNRRLAATLFLHEGWCKFQLGDANESEECYLKAKELMGVDVERLTFSQLDWDDVSTISTFPLEEATLLYQWSLLRLWECFPDQECIGWLYRAFVLSSPGSPLFRKVCQFLAILHFLEFTEKGDRELKELAAFFHQASIGSMIRQQHLLTLEFKLNQSESNIQRSCLKEVVEALRVLQEGSNNRKAEIKTMMEGLPPATVCCISLVEQEFCFLLKKSQCENPVAGWLLLSRFGSDIVVSLLPIPSTNRCHAQANEHVEEPGTRNGRSRYRSVLEADDLTRSIMGELVSILQESRQSTSCLPPISTPEEKTSWWKWRTVLDSRLASYLRDIEDSWFGPWKCLLLGEPSQHSVAQAFRKQAKELYKMLKSKTFLGQIKTAKVPEEALIKLLLQAVGCLQTEQLHEGIAAILGWNHERGGAAIKEQALIEKAAEAFLLSFASVMDGQDQTRGSRSKSRSRKDNVEKPREANLITEGVQSEPVELVLDGNLQALPWENLPIMRKHEIYRMPSLGSIRAAFLHHRQLLRSTELSEQLLRLRLDENCALDKQNRPAVNPHNAFYLLNPGGDLESTQTAFEEWFRRQKGWEGKAGQVPSVEEYIAGLQQHNLFVYLGHGSGEQYFPEKHLRKLEHCPASLLMGCSSGRFTSRGEYEPVGVPLAYLMAGCPLAVANLWDVTDGDIDRFSRVVLQRWLESPVSPRPSAPPVTQKASRRGRCSSKTVQEQDSKAEDWEDIYIGPSIEAGREACRLPYLIGASPVCFGIPTVIRRSTNNSSE